ncbi:hypothetical protein [Phyllobacterium meliloti]|uniref:hypothetical protein n=1 Tax=Phyllobacterium meliloti TaxID=555317 RepID=UPI001D137DFA|nr:hypothetical protein [Phyllobacterium sp. T1293]UGX87053.1 hypothetical protein LLE53_004165 [Phyllobacterium sp. T1293]
MNAKVPTTLGNCCAVNDRFLIVVSFPHSVAQDEVYTRLFYLNLDHPELWQHRDLPGETIVSVCLRKEREGIKRAGCALSNEGLVEIANSSEEIREKIPDAGIRDLEPGRPILGYVNNIKEIDGQLFVCGSSGQIYRRDPDKWQAIDGGLVAKSQSIQSRIAQRDNVRRDNERLRDNVKDQLDIPELIAIDGLNVDGVYTVGLGGQLYYFDGRVWNKQNTSTKEHLLDLHCVSDDEVIVSGYRQTLLSGNARDGFQLLHESNEDIKFWSVRKFQGEIYVGTVQGLRRFNGSTFDIIRQSDIGFDETTVIQQIDSVSDSYLWIVGDKHAFRYDGKIVQKFLHPDNV